MLRTNQYNCFRKGFMGSRVCKNWLLGTEGAKIAVSKKGSKGVQNQKICYLSNNESLLRPKYWQMLRAN